MGDKIKHRQERLPRNGYAEAASSRKGGPHGDKRDRRSKEHKPIHELIQDWDEDDDQPKR